jgi:hypothetical protein
MNYYLDNLSHKRPTELDLKEIWQMLSASCVYTYDKVWLKESNNGQAD